MARAIWSGAISFGLVAVPVKLHPATEQKDIRFHQFKEGTKQRIRNKRVSEATGREVDYEDIVKGYEVDKGKFVIVTPEELEAVAPEKTRTIEIEDFVPLEEIDPIYFEKTYYLAPEDEAGAKKAYALLLESMKKEGQVAIGRFVMRTKEYLAAIRAGKLEQQQEGRASHDDRAPQDLTEGPEARESLLTPQRKNSRVAVRSHGAFLSQARGPVRSEALPHTGPMPSEAGARWYPAGKASLPGPPLRVRRGAWRAFPIPARPLAEGAC
jgi:hypothetical protein